MDKQTIQASIGLAITLGLAVWLVRVIYWLWDRQSRSWAANDGSPTNRDRSAAKK